MMDSVNSTTFIKRPPCMTDTQEKFLYTKELLSGRIFLGHYTERRLVEVLKEYRDVVVIDSEETDLHADIDKIRKKLYSVSDIKWRGITGPDSSSAPKSYCFWVKLTNIPFGHYWFQIKHVKLTDGEISLQLKCIRKIQTSQIGLQKSLTEPRNETSESLMPFQSSLSRTNSDFEPMKILTSFRETCNETIQNIQPHLTLRNLLMTIRMSCLLAMAIVVGAVSLIGHLGEFFLKLIRELSILVTAFTPIIIQLIDLLCKVIGGLYILLARAFFGNRYPRRPESFEIVNLHGPQYSKNPVPGWRERNQMLRQELLSTNMARK